MLDSSLEFIRPSREYRELALLSEVGRGGRVSQRSLARASSVSATMINAYVDDLVSRGLLEVSGETNRTYRYALTAAGAERRDALLARVSREVARLYRGLEERMSDRLAAHRAAGVRRVAVWGDVETAALVRSAARRAGLEVAGVVDPAAAGPGAAVAPSALPGLRADAVIVVTRPEGDSEAPLRQFEASGGRVLAV